MQTTFHYFTVDIVCDICGDQHLTLDSSVNNFKEIDEINSTYLREEFGWHMEWGKHICPRCWKAYDGVTYLTLNGRIRQ